MTKYLRVKHATSSHYSGSNDFTEWMVKTVKNVMRMAPDSGESSVAALPSFRTIPKGDSLPSSSELLHDRNITRGKFTKLETNFIFLS